MKKRLPESIKIQKTPLVTIDSYLRKFGCNFPLSFIKIDVQGYELPVCEGMTETLARNPDTVIGFEYCPRIMEALGFHPENIFKFFYERGYQLYFLSSKNRIKPFDIKKGGPQSLQIKTRGYIDILCARRNLAE